jgi:hypothetical protein
MGKEPFNGSISRLGPRVMAVWTDHELLGAVLVGAVLAYPEL